VKTHPRDAFNDKSAKYLLGPGLLRAASETFPAASTCTFTTTRTVPWMLANAALDGLGKI
jgi:hypothetical protein